MSMTLARRSPKPKATPFGDGILPPERHPLPAPPAAPTPRPAPSKPRPRPSTNRRDWPAWTDEQRWAAILDADPGPVGPPSGCLSAEEFEDMEYDRLALESDLAMELCSAEPRDDLSPAELAYVRGVDGWRAPSGRFIHNAP